ncbi:PREDICTED: uncharacterized protein LOC106810185 [Priapulus caudatus]|uniref:Uncharacterized protein LOC106810185 n=1 Tax=Priapulus caudatus TaxID=37621 RepID=A0ABM1E9T1_PRICU|nr:PREDICTED: uncharacterized protein LOC106810185 [Priapulus caudatus]
MMNCEKDITELYQAVEQPTQSAALAAFNRRTENIVNVFVLPVLIVVGVVGNATNLVVWCRPRMRIAGGIQCSLSGVAAANIVVLLTVIPSLVQHASDEFTLDLMRAKVVCHALHNAFRHVGMWLAVTIAVVRYVAVRYPLLVNAWMTVRQARLIVVAIFVGVVLLDSPRLFQFGVCRYETSVVMNFSSSSGGGGAAIANASAAAASSEDSWSRTIYFIAQTKFWRERAHVVYPWISGGMFFVLPMCLVFVFNIFLVRQLPEAIYTVLLGLSSPQLDAQERHAGAVSIVNCITMINCSLNFGIYCLLSRRYKQVFRDTFCCVRAARFDRLMAYTAGKRKLVVTMHGSADIPLTCLDNPRPRAGTMTTVCSRSIDVGHR